MTPPRPQKIDLAKVRAALTTTCPKCGKVIQPSEVKRLSFDEMQCPGCGAAFQAGKKAT